jgi:hypothetical protein
LRLGDEANSSHAIHADTVNRGREVAQTKEYIQPIYRTVKSEVRMLMVAMDQVH